MSSGAGRRTNHKPNKPNTPTTPQEVSEVAEGAVLSMAIRMGEIRLLDNVILEA